MARLAKRLIKLIMKNTAKNILKLVFLWHARLKVICGDKTIKMVTHCYNELCDVAFKPCCTGGCNPSEPIKILCTAHTLATGMARPKKSKSPRCHLASISVADLYGTASVALKHRTHTLLLVLLYAVSQETNSWNYWSKVCYSASWHTDGVLANATKLVPVVKLCLTASRKQDSFLPLVMPNRMVVSDDHFWGYFHCRTIWRLRATMFLTTPSMPSWHSASNIVTRRRQCVRSPELVTQNILQKWACPREWLPKNTTPGLIQSHVLPHSRKQRVVTHIIVSEHSTLLSNFVMLVATQQIMKDGHALSQRLGVHAASRRPRRAWPLCVVLYTVVGAEGNEKAWHMTQ